MWFEIIIDDEYTKEFKAINGPGPYELYRKDGFGDYYLKSKDKEHSLFFPHELRQVQEPYRNPILRDLLEVLDV